MPTLTPENRGWQATEITPPLHGAVDESLAASLRSPGSADTSPFTTLGRARVPVDLYTFVDLYDRALDATAHILTKGAEHIKARGDSEAEMLDWRLIHDMQPLRFQVMVVCNFTRQWTARVAALPVPEHLTEDRSLAEFHAAIAESKAFLAGLTPAHFEGRDDVPLTVMIGTGMEPTLPAARWLTVFAPTNLYFHLSPAYGILRAHGVQIGKVDLFPGGL